MRILVRSALVSFAFLCLIPIAPAQNCAGTTVGLTPLPALGTGTYLGFEGGLYSGGSNIRPIAHTIDGMSQATCVVPRDSAGGVDPAGKIVCLSIGPSYLSGPFQRLALLSAGDVLRHPSVVLVDGAQGDMPASETQNPASPFWTVVDERLVAAGVTREQVQVIWMELANEHRSTGFPSATLVLESQTASSVQNVHDSFPNARLCWLQTRVYAGYAVSTLNPEPYAYEQGFACKWLIDEQVSGAASLNFDPADGVVEAPWLDWGTYNWADGILPNADGLSWICAEFSLDGTHISALGQDKIAQRILTFLQTDPIASSWYLAEPAPSAFGVGKATSQDSLPAVSWSGTPSFSSSDFVFRYTGGIPNAFGLGFFGALPDLAPFANGSRYVGLPLTRLPAQQLDGSGAGAFPIAVTASMVGTTGFYQGYLRDAAHPDGTGVGLSDGLRVVFAN